MKYKRILLKLSGEALSGERGFGYDYDFVQKVTDELIALKKQGVQIGLVIGGGNFWRGRQSGDMDRTAADQMGMLATVMNGLMVKDFIEKSGEKVELLSAVEMPKVAESYTKRAAVKYLEEGKIVIFSGGTGSPYFSTDTAAALRAAEIGADVILLAKNIDGVYDSDPKTNKDAKRFDELTFSEYIERNLKAMDITAITMCMENNIPVFCFRLTETSVLNAVCGKEPGTIIKM